jgi:hypothetical protein
MKYNKFYDAQATENTGGYGYQEDEVKVSPFVFGLNAGNTFLKKFGWIPNGGKGGAEQEALEIIFEINGTEKSYRKFPIVKAFGKNNEEITDPNAPEFKEALGDFNAVITHILHTFVDSGTLKASMQRRITSFKEYCQLCESILPKDYATIPLDIFMQYQWQLRGDQDRTFLEIPQKMKYGKWLVKAVTPVGSWKAVKTPNPADEDRAALIYKDDAGNIHPFVKTGWFVNSAFANQQKVASSDSSSTNGQAKEAMNAGTNVANTTTTGTGNAAPSSW